MLRFIVLTGFLSFVSLFATSANAITYRFLSERVAAQDGYSCDEVAHCGDRFFAEIGLSRSFLSSITGPTTFSYNLQYPTYRRTTLNAGDLPILRLTMGVISRGVTERFTWEPLLYSRASITVDQDLNLLSVFSTFVNDRPDVYFDGSSVQIRYVNTNPEFLSASGSWVLTGVPVPLPAGWLLLMTALGGLAFARRRFSS